MSISHMPCVSAGEVEALRRLLASVAKHAGAAEQILTTQARDLRAIRPLLATALAALSAQAGAAPGAGELPNVEAFAEALYETDYVEGDDAKGEWALMISCAAEGPFLEPSEKIVARYRARAAVIRARLTLQPGGGPVAAEEDWRPITELSPQFQGQVWVIGGRYVTAELSIAAAGWWTYEAERGSKSVPTHWAPCEPPSKMLPTTSGASSGGEGRDG